MNEETQSCDSYKAEYKRNETSGDTGCSQWAKQGRILRTLILGAEVRAKPCTHHADLLRKVAGLCNNANQLAHVANATGTASQESVNEMLRISRKVWEEVREMW